LTGLVVADKQPCQGWWWLMSSLARAGGA